MTEIKMTSSQGGRMVYISPIVESVSVRVELGFALSTDNLEQAGDNDLESF